MYESPTIIFVNFIGVLAMNPPYITFTSNTIFLMVPYIFNKENEWEDIIYLLIHILYSSISMLHSTDKQTIAVNILSHTHRSSNHNRVMLLLAIHFVIISFDLQSAMQQFYFSIFYLPNSRIRMHMTTIKFSVSLFKNNDTLNN